jgi:hypothetical protein
MAIQDLNITSARPTGNGAAHPVPTSRRAFLKSAPRRLGLLKDLLEGLGIRLDAIECYLPDPEIDEARDRELHRRVDVLAAAIADFAALTKPTWLLAVRFDALAADFLRLRKRLGRVDRRSARSRRRLAGLATQNAASRS